MYKRQVSYGRGWWTFRLLADDVDGDVPGVHLKVKSSMHVLLATVAGFSAAIGIISGTPFTAVGLSVVMVSVYAWWMNRIVSRVFDVLHLGVLEEVRVRQLPAATSSATPVVPPPATLPSTSASTSAGA